MGTCAKQSFYLCEKLKHDLKLVHTMVEVNDKRMFHAFCISESHVLDFSNGRKVVEPINTYYKKYNIDTMTNYKMYTYEEALNGACIE